MGERLLAVLLVASTVGCEDVVEISDPLSCEYLYDVLPARSIVVPVGGSRRLSVRLAEEAELPPGNDYSDFSHCLPMSLELFRWSIGDEGIARVEPYGGAVVTITGLAVGETEIRVRYSTYHWIGSFVRLTVVAPSGDAHGGSPNPTGG